MVPKLGKTQLLFLVILLEGYVVLACELLAIRLLIPFVGSGTETISILISAVLLPLAVGYYAGGRIWRRHYRRAGARGRTGPSIRALLLKNILSALFVLALGLSYLFLEFFFTALSALGITSRLLQTAIYSALFLVLPVFLLGQTVPLVSHYFSRARLSEITGRMLFYSTAGSFLGSVFSTIVLMTWLGVHRTVIVTLALLFVLLLLLSRRLFSYEVAAGAFALLLVVALNNNALFKAAGIVANNNYNTVEIIPLPQEDAKILRINRSTASKLTGDESRQLAYVAYLEKQFLAPLANAARERDILIIGAGGFVLGRHDDRNRYVYVDIDPQLKAVAETAFQGRKLGANKRFVAASARGYLRANPQRFDLIIVDAFTNTIAVPMECTTREFLQDVKRLLKPGGTVAVNMIASPDFADRFSIRYDNTFASVFPAHTRQVLQPFDPWRGASRPPPMVNILYSYHDRPGIDDRTVYTDDRNTYSLDR